MLATNPTHAALLASGGPLVMVELITLTLAGGGVLHYANALVPQTWDGQVYDPLAWEHSEITLCLGLEVDSLEINFFPRLYPISCQDPAAEDLILGLPWIKAVRLGLLAGARLRLDRADIDPLTGPEIVGILNQFTGTVAEPSLEDSLKLVVKSDLEIFNRQIPANLYQPGCRYTLFDAGCGLAAAAWAVEDTVAAGSGLLTLNCGLAQAADYFALGIIEFSTGPNAGARRTVKSYAPGVLTLAAPLLAAPVAGDTFTVWPGCDKQLSTCAGKFANYLDDAETLAASGEPFIPKPETAI